MESKRKLKTYKYFGKTEGGDVVEFAIQDYQKPFLYQAKSIYETDTKTILVRISEPKDCKLCKYCGMPTFHKEPDILCEDCREEFGHTFYSEL